MTAANSTQPGLQAKGVAPPPIPCPAHAQTDAVLFTRRNADVRPFEPGGEASLEFFADKADCGAFCLASHSKKRPHNLTLGRFFDRRLLDLLELGVERFRPLKAFGAVGTGVQAGNKARRVAI